MKKILLCVAVAFCLLFASCAVGGDKDTERPEEPIRLNAASSNEIPIVNFGNATNVVIFICFADENPNEIRDSIPSDFRDRCNGEDNSIYDYYYDLSYGKFSFTSVFPSYNDESFYIYRDSHKRSYYTGNNSSSGSGRTGPESTLLNNAVYEASVYLDLTGHDLDVNGDGFVDCVTFLISGNYSDKNWNKIMWPHSWQLNDITREYNSQSSSASLGGKKVNDYTFLFLDTVSSRVGLMCHELGHAVGNLPDLYHYKSSYAQYLPVGYWDLMHLDCDTPQFMTTYIRWKYLSFINDNQIVEMERSGDYTLKPTTMTGEDGTLAYKLTIDNGTSSPNESIWIEYRRNDVSTYDKDLPGSGLIVYRINTNAEEGNKNARYQTASYPDELFVFRPDVSSKEKSEKEKENLSYAYISNDNPKFTHLGDAASTTKYDQNCIYLSNGKNTGIVVTVLAEGPESITFHVELGNYDSSEIDYNASYIQGNTKNKNEVEIYYGEDIKSQINLYVKRKNRGIYRAEDASITLLGGDELYQICEEGKNAYLEYADDYGTYRFSYFLIIHDKLESATATVVSLPSTTDYVVGDEFSLNGLVIRAAYSSGVRTVAYSTESADSWQVFGYDMTTSGVQDITVVYNGDVRIHFSIIVRSNIVSIRVDEKTSKHISGVTLFPCYNVIATYSGGLELPLSESEYTVQEGSVYDYARTSVTIRAVDNDAAFCYSYFYTVPERLTAITLLDKPKKEYKYGEALDLSAGKIQLTFGNFTIDADEALPLENYFDLINVSYRPTRAGKQTLKFTLEDAVFSLDVNVQPIPDNLLAASATDIRINDGSSVVLLDKDYALSELKTRLSSYLSVSFTLSVGKDTYAISPETYGEMLLQSDVKIVLKNADDIVVKEYTVYRTGDGNNDGKVDRKDVVYWKAAIIARDETSKGIQFDRTGDKKFTLTDYVLLLDSVKEEQ